MAAISAAGQGADVILLERNPRPGRKLMITGKGRCNITNNCDRYTLLANVAVNPRFLYSAFAGFMPSDTMDFFESRGVPLKTERGSRVFPCSDKAVDIVDAMVSACRGAGVKLLTGVRAEGLIVDNTGDDAGDRPRVTGVKAGGRVYDCDAVVTATGGVSYPQTGSDGDGYIFARETGHRVVPVKPSLVPLVIKEPDCGEMSGLSLKNIAVKVRNAKGKQIYEDFGELLFTHFGLSGPVILSASSHMPEPAGCVISIDLKPALTPEKLDARLLRDFSQNLNREFRNALGGLLPKSMEPVIVRRSGIPPGLRVNSVTREQRARLCELLKSYTLTVEGFRPVEEAIVTSGGVDVRDIDPKTMRSKVVDGLYFAGEVIDVDAHTGGFNLQIALATGRLAGISAAAAANR